MLNQGGGFIIYNSNRGFFCSEVVLRNHMYLVCYFYRSYILF